MTSHRDVMKLTFERKPSISEIKAVWVTRYVHRAKCILNIKRQQLCKPYTQIRRLI